MMPLATLPIDDRLTRFVGLMDVVATFYRANSVIAGKRGFTLDMSHVSDVDFDASYTRALDVSFDGVPFKVIHLNDLITEKQATGRLKNLSDMEELMKLRDNTERS